MDVESSTPRAVSRIVLTGFMGAGKSTIGPILAKLLGWRFIDVDDHLQAQAGVTIAEFFSMHGEARFRQIEAEAFAELHRETSIIIAVGGGAIESQSTRTLIEQSDETCMVLLKAPLAVLVERCEAQPGAAVRPVLLDRELLTQRFHWRQQYYNQARVQIDTHGLTPGLVAERITHRLREEGLLPVAPLNPIATKVMAD